MVLRKGKVLRKAIFDNSLGLWKIPLTKGYYAFVDEWNFEFLQQWNWIVKLYKDGRRKYAYRIEKTPFGATNIYMHRVVAERAGILGTTKLQVDHRNNLETLDNRVSNLRAATSRQNGCNKARAKNNTSGFKGVTRTPKGNGFRARININGKLTYLGCKKTAEEAGALYAAASRKYHGEFGRTE